MHISEELRKISKNIRPSQPRPSEEFVSILEPYKEKKAGAKAKEDLRRFDLFVVRKSHLPVFEATKNHEMCFNGDCNWVVDDASRLNELIRRFLKFRNDYVRAVIYDNILPAPQREDRWIFNYDHGIRHLDRLYEYDAIVKEKYLKELERIPRS